MRLPRLLCLDLHDVAFCDAHTVGALLRLSRRLPLALINPSRCALRAVDLLDDELSLRALATVEDAIAAMDHTDHVTNRPSGTAGKAPHQHQHVTR